MDALALPRTIRRVRSHRHRWMGLVGVVVLAIVVVGAPPTHASSVPLTHLRPGERANVVLDVPVTTVFVGLEPGSGPTGIDEDRYLSAQPLENQVGDRTTRFFERESSDVMGDWYDRFLEPSSIGLLYRYDYPVVFADDAFEDAFFEHLASIALGPIPGGTVFQQAYSANPLAAEPISASYVVEATAAEHWLAANAGPMLGIDTTRPTVFLVNWFGRADFRFHTYAFFGQRPGTEFPLGVTHAGQMVAWGGSPADAPYGGLGREARVWFYDVSAGPDYSTANWLLDLADFDGDGIAEERIPPIWEYGTTHWYRPFDDLTGDLARLTRFVAVDALFGASPIYDPAISEPLLADSIELDLNLFAGRPGRDPSATLSIAGVLAALSRLDPSRAFGADIAVSPLDGRLSDVFDCQQTAFTSEPGSCYGNLVRDDPTTALDENVFSNLDVYFSDATQRYLDGTRYEVPLAIFDVSEQRLAPNAIAGFASVQFPNLQGWTYAWLADRFRANALTDTGLVTHETGHHLGLSHVHDAFDPDLDEDVSSADGGAFWFMNAGHETYTVMSYLPNTDEFGRFDRDHLARWQLAAWLDNANRILGDVVASPRADRVEATIHAADVEAGEALAKIAAWDLEAAAASAAEAYKLVLTAAAGAGIRVEPYAGVADQEGVGVHASAIDSFDLRAPLPAGGRDPLGSYMP